MRREVSKASGINGQKEMLDVQRGLIFTMLGKLSILAFCSGLMLSAFSAMGQTNSSLIASSLPPVGVASSESLQVNLVNNATGPADPNSTAPLCSGTIVFYGATGSAIGAAMNFAIGGGAIFSASLPYSAMGATGGRTVVRAAITLSTTWAGLVPPPACALGSSIETFDTLTGVTHAFAAGTTPPLTVALVNGQVHAANANK